MQNLHIPVNYILQDRFQLVSSNYIVNYIVVCDKSRFYHPISHCSARHYHIQHYRKHYRTLYR